MDPKLINGKKIEDSLPIHILRILRREPGYQFPPVIFSEVTFKDDKLNEHTIDDFAAAVKALDEKELIRVHPCGDIRISHHGKNVVDNFIAMMN